jgi:hypothetical protein
MNNPRRKPMSDVFKPFTPAPAVSQQVFANADPAPKKERKKRERKVAAVNAPAKAVAEAPAKKPRKPRAAKAPKVRAPKGMKVGIETALALRHLKEDDAKVFEKIAGLLSGAGKPQRARIMAALGKVFG